MTLALPPISGNITQFRYWIQQRMLQRQGKKRNLVIFAVDGIHYNLAEQLWPSAKIACWQAVFPPTSSTCWLSSLTGRRVDEHGVAGVVYRPRTDNSALINIYDYQGAGVIQPEANIFTDAAYFGYLPQAIAGDLLPVAGAWTRALLTGAVNVDHTPFFTRSPLPSSAILIAAVEKAIERALSQSFPTLIWCFIDLDQYIHHYGYDDLVADFLIKLEKLAHRLTLQQVDVIAHADHGLVATRHDESVARILNDLSEKYSCPMGGAGRTRWFYTDPTNFTSLEQALHCALGNIADIVPAETMLKLTGFDAIGNLLVIARGETFITPEGYRYDHGSLLPQELNVPCALWESVC